MATYPYSSGNLLVARNTYFYTKYEGYPFLVAWRDSRAKIASSMTGKVSGRDESTISVKPLEEFISPKKGSIIFTRELLSALNAALQQDDPASNPDTLKLMGILIRRFEVFKRIHTSYDWRFRAIDKEDFKDLDLYIQAAEVYEKGYAKGLGIPCLNVLLKILDSLCALVEGINDNSMTRLKILLGKEQMHVKELAAGLGVEI